MKIVPVLTTALTAALTLGLSLALPAGHASAETAVAIQDGGLRNAFYLGAGKARHDGAFEADDTPFALGFTHQLQGRKLILGFDIAREGTMLDSTWGHDQALRQATSYNLLVGGNIVDNGRFRTDLALVLGARESFADCADSYLGFQCYADAEPETEYKGNFGALLTVSYDRLTVGLRATGESTQILGGFRF